MRIVLALCCLVVVYAQVPCESPKQWEGRRIFYDRTQNFRELAKMSYDETYQRVRIVEEIEIGQDKEYYDVLYLHSIGKEYRYNFRTRQCNVTQITRPFRPSGVPPDADFRGSATLGAAGVPGEFVVIENFAGQLGDDFYFGFVTSPDCFPVQDNFYSNTTGLFTASYFDVTLGVTDPNVFIPPRECFML